MHDTILGPARRPSPQLSANAELQLGAVVCEGHRVREHESDLASWSLSES